VSNTGEESTPDDPFFSKKFISGDTQIADIETPRLGKITQEEKGETIFDFGPAGLTEFLTIHFKTPDGKAFQTVVAFPNTGKVKILEGNQELSL
jgi:general secretion pathway protein H